MTLPRIVLADALFEGALGVVLLTGAAAGWLDSGDVPAPVGMPLIAGVGCLLLGLGVFLFLLARQPVPRTLLQTLATGNLATACAAVAWRAAVSGFSAAGTALLLATAIALVVLAAVQLWAAGWKTAPSVKPGSPPQTMSD